MSSRSAPFRCGLSFSENRHVLIRIREPSQRFLVQYNMGLGPLFVRTRVEPLRINQPRS
jgi:hypothetical protein